MFHSLRPQVALSWLRQPRAREDAFARQLLKTRLTVSFWKGGATCGWEIPGKCPGATFSLQAVRQHTQSLLLTWCSVHRAGDGSFAQQARLVGHARSLPGKEGGWQSKGSPAHKVTSVEPLGLQRTLGNWA